MHVSPVPYRTGHGPVAGDCQLIAVSGYELRIIDLGRFDLDARATLIFELEASLCFEIDLGEQLAGDASLEHVVDDFLPTIVEGTIDVVQEVANKLPEAFVVHVDLAVLIEEQDSHADHGQPGYCQAHRRGTVHSKRSQQQGQQYDTESHCWPACPAGDCL